MSGALGSTAGSITLNGQRFPILPSLVNMMKQIRDARAARVTLISISASSGIMAANQSSMIGPVYNIHGINVFQLIRWASPSYGRMTRLSGACWCFEVSSESIILGARSCWLSINKVGAECPDSCGREHLGFGICMILARDIFFSAQGKLRDGTEAFHNAALAWYSAVQPGTKVPSVTPCIRPFRHTSRPIHVANSLSIIQQELLCHDPLPLPRAPENVPCSSGAKQTG